MTLVSRKKTLSKTTFAILVKLLFVLSLSSCATHKATVQEEVNTGQDFARPLYRFDVRSEVEQSGSEEMLTWTFRVDAPIPLDNGWKLSTRFDLPIVHSQEHSRDNPHGDWEAGIGDVLAQAVLITPRHDSWAAGVGVRTIWPTATQDQFGTGRCQLAPLVGAVHYPDWLPEGSHVGCVLKDFFDVGGESDRDDIHQLSIQPILHIDLEDPSGTWILTFEPDIRINWEDDNKWHVPFNVTVGKMLGEKVVISVEWNQTLIDSFDRYDWKVEFRIGFFF